MNVLSRCPKCGAQIPLDSPSEFCPRCLMAAGLASGAESVANKQGTTPHSPRSSGRRGFQPPTPSELAAHFPQLEILELVGAGGMGAVYRVRQNELDRIVALKILPPQLSEDPAFAERFAREARAMARLSHPHVVTIFDFGRTPPRVPQSDDTAGPTELYYLLMEYIDGANLRQRLKEGEVDAAQALSITSQICDALSYAHDENVVHRDIKPENILIDHAGRVKIGDFGLAKIVLDAPQEFSLTATRELLGTFRYMAPEQLEGGRVVDRRSDIYALGVVLYELLTSEVPMGRFRPPSEKAGTDPRLDTVVMRALEPEPDARYQSASDFKGALDSIASSTTSHSGLSTFTSRWTSGMWSGVWSSTQRRPANGWVVGCRLLGMLAAFGGLMVACFLAWEGVRVELIERPATFSFSTTIAEQTSLGWHTLPGQLSAVAFGVVLLHLVGNLQRLRWLSHTYAEFFLCGFAVVAFSAWSLSRSPALSEGLVQWKTSEWEQYRDQSGAQVGSVLATPRAYLESIARQPGETEDNNTLDSLSHTQLIDSLIKQGKLSLSSSYWANGPYAGLGIGIGMTFIGLLEFMFTFATVPTRNILTAARSSLSSWRSSSQVNSSEPRVSKMAVLAAFLAAFPLVPLAMLISGTLDRVGAGPAVDSFGFYPNTFAHPGNMFAAACAMAGLSVLPTTIGLIALYRIRRYPGRLHGLPLAFTASIMWPLIVVDTLAFAVTYTLTDGHHEAAFSVLATALMVNIVVYVGAWFAVRKPLEPTGARSIAAPSTGEQPRRV